MESGHHLKIELLQATAGSMQIRIQSMERKLKLESPNRMSTQFDDHFMNSVFSDQNFTQRMIGMGSKTFDELLTKSLSYFESLNISGEPYVVEYNELPSERLLLSPRQQLFICLFWLRHYPIMILLQVLFGIHERTLIKYIFRTLKVLSKALSSVIRWPTDEEFREEARILKLDPKKKFPNAVCIVDGSEFLMRRPSAEPAQTRLYSGKKKHHALSVLFCCLRSGRIIFRFDSFIGTMTRGCGINQTSERDSKANPTVSWETLDSPLTGSETRSPS